MTGPRVSGTLEARVRAVVRAEVGGAVVAVGPAIGQAVTKGDLLVRIESKALGDTVTSARSGVTSAEAQLALAQREVERTRALVEGGAVAARELERARSAEVAARAAVSQARAQLSGSRSQLGDATMRSPIAGVVAQRMINVGDIVGGGATLYEVIDPSSMRLSGQVASDDLAALAVGSRVRFEVRGYKQQRFEGTIARISPAADPATRQIPVIVEIPNPGGALVAGLYAEGRVAAEARDALIVPLGAIDSTRDQPTVLRAKAGLLERVTVAIGLRDERAEVAEITSGLAPGDVVVLTRAATSLRAGQKVELGVVVFVPIAFMGGVAEQWFAPFALTIACSVLVSLFVSFSLDPMLSAVWEDPDVIEGRRSWLSKKLDVFDRAFQRLTRWYKRVIRWALGHRLLMVVIALASFVGALAIPATGLVGSSFFPVQDRSEFQIQIETAPGSNLEYTRRKVLDAVAIARSRPEVLYTYSTIGGQTGTVDTASVYVRLSPKQGRARHQDQVAQDLRDEIRRLSGVTAYISTGGFGTDKQIQIRITGPDTDVLNGVAESIAAEVAQVPGAVDLGLSSKGLRPEVEVVLDRQLAGQLGVSAATLALALRPAFAGLDAGDWSDPAGETRDVVVRLGEDWRRRPENLEALPITLPGVGQGAPATVPLGQVAKVTRGFGPAQIEHLDGERVVTVGANTEGRPLSAVIGDIDARIGAVSLPPGYQRLQGGESEDQAEVFGRILIALGGPGASAGPVAGPVAPPPHAPVTTPPVVGASADPRP